MQTQALTPEQQNWLKTNTIMPTLFVVIILGVFCGIFTCLFTGLKGTLFFTIFTAAASLLIFAVLVAVGMHVYNNLMDLHDGVAQVHTGKLNIKKQTHRSPRTFYAEFDHIGSVTIMGDVYEKLEEGKTYRVTYSPRTRRGWEVDLRS
ncbi:MAG: hypothetical protein IPP55_11740 [Anaerolineales bacterium]|nr:hypothetical protein [Anaerolineales bacterium]